jgi:cytochrome c oxidase subunit 3
LAGQAVNHDYHLVEPSPWPFVASLSVFILALGAVIFMKGFVGPDAGEMSAMFLGKGAPWIMTLGVLGVLYTMIGWWGDVIRESRAGDHTPVVEIGLRYGMILFIASEVMFFVAWFWMFFELGLFHEIRAGGVETGWATDRYDALAGFAQWPPEGVETFDPFHLPLINTLILLLSGTTVTWAHHAVQHGVRSEAKLALWLTVILGVSFTGFQILEYTHAHFAFGGNLYGATFFMATGFHGAHVVIGTIFLAVCLIRLYAGHFSPKKHFGFEAAAWYWHFVDVVWLFLFAFIYIYYQ